MATEADIQRVREFYEQILSQHAFDRMDEYVHEDFRDHNMMPGLPQGLEGARQTFRIYHSAFPDMTMTVEDMYSDGDMVISRILMQGTHQGELMGIPPSGNSVACRGIDILRIDGDKAVERWGQFDDLGMMQQIGVVSPMVQGVSASCVTRTILWCMSQRRDLTDAEWLRYQ